MLGSVEGWTEERPPLLGRPRYVALLALLLVNANRAVSANAVIDAVWGGRPRRSCPAPAGVAPLGPWLRAYIRGLRHRPAGWALHDYTEVRGRNTLQLRTLMSMTSGPIWLDETGGVLRRGHWWYPNQSATAAAKDEQFLLSLTKRHHRIARIYHYEGKGVATAGWDSGLIAPNGSPRPAYTVLLNWLRLHSSSR